MAAFCFYPISSNCDIFLEPSDRFPLHPQPNPMSTELWPDSIKSWELASLHLCFLAWPAFCRIWLRFLVCSLESEGLLASSLSVHFKCSGEGKLEGHVLSFHEILLKFHQLGERMKKDENRDRKVRQKPWGHGWAGKEDQQGAVVKGNKTSLRSQHRYLLPLGLGGSYLASLSSSIKWYKNIMLL